MHTNALNIKWGNYIIIIIIIIIKYGTTKAVSHCLFIMDH